jgi:histidine triad (HIT) family protein
MNALGECIFCKIIRREIPAQRIFESDSVLAILDAFPVVEGHVLVMPRRHLVSIIEAADEDLAEVMRVVKIVAPAVMKFARADGLNVVSNNGRCAGQVVPHVHFHIVPRREGDGLHGAWKQRKYEEGRAEAVCREIRALIDEAQ